MEIFYEIMMRNGFCFVVGTNHEGICEFSINGNEFVIHTFTDGNGEFINFSFSVDTGLDFDLRRDEHPFQEDFSVLSVRRVDEKRKKYLQKINRKVEESKNVESLVDWQSNIMNMMLRFSAHQGCINTPAGWVYA